MSTKLMVELGFDNRGATSLYSALLSALNHYHGEKTMEYIFDKDDVQVRAYCPACSEDLTLPASSIRTEKTYFCGDFTGVRGVLTFECPSCDKKTEAEVFDVHL